MNRRAFIKIFLGIILTILLFIISVIFDFDFFEKTSNAILILEKYEIDELLIAAVFFLLYFLVSSVIVDRIYYKKSLQRKELFIKRIYHESQNILNNFLNEMTYFKVQIEEQNDKETLSLFEETIQNAKSKVKEIEHISQK